MNVNKVNTVQYPQVRKDYKLRAAKEGAVVTSGILTASTGFSWITDKPYMQRVVKESGGKGRYAAKFALGITVFSAAGALINTVLSAAVKKTAPKKTPKAVN